MDKISPILCRAFHKGALYRVQRSHVGPQRQGARGRTPRRRPPSARAWRDRARRASDVINLASRPGPESRAGLRGVRICRIDPGSRATDKSSTKAPAVPLLRLRGLSAGDRPAAVGHTTRTQTQTALPATSSRQESQQLGSLVSRRCGPSSVAAPLHLPSVMVGVCEHELPHELLHGRAAGQKADR
jgi:hypothetical protein